MALAGRLVRGVYGATASAGRQRAHCSAGRLTGDSCEPQQRPPCPPCEPAPRPPCRAPGPQRAKGVVITCCPPPRGHKPPCPTAAPMCALTCEHAQSAPSAACPPPCSRPRLPRAPCSRGHVAERLRAAADERRRHYEAEVAAGPPAPPPDPPALRLPRDYDCVTATDGRQYALQHQQHQPAAPPTAACAPPDRTPPPPRQVELVVDSTCQPARHHHVDPCQHEPRKVVHIYRAPSDHQPKVTPPSAPPPQDAPTGRAPAEGLTTRIMKTFSLGRNASAGGGSDSGYGQCHDVPAGTARRAGDTAWCDSLPPPKPAAAPCRPPSTAERMRRRTAPCPPRRHLHIATTATTATAAAAADAAALSVMLQQRAQYPLSARGRETPPLGRPAPRAPIPHAALDLRVPPGADTVRVRVSLEPPVPPCAPAPAGPCCVSATSAGSDSWLSIKKLQLKWSGSKRSDTCKDNNPPVPPTDPCAPKQPASPPVNPYAPNKSPKPASHRCAPKKPATAPASPCSSSKPSPPNPCAPSKPVKSSSCPPSLTFLPYTIFVNHY